MILLLFVGIFMRIKGACCHGVETPAHAIISLECYGQS